ncbi:MAG TPA: HAD domain-containing protein [Gammaproteobacteria bacterium]|nr:HAD domain-containing protein [Gammaproteobacteria bacterium]
MKHDYPIIFLDIDGVLNSSEYVHARGGAMPPRWLIVRHGPTLAHEVWDIAPTLLGRLRQLVEDTGARIVISSTWRLGQSPDHFHLLFERRGWPLPRETIIGCTPTLRGLRGNEIATWIETAGFTGPYVILDDDSDMLPGQPFIHVDRSVGLSQGNCHDAKAFLISEGPPA